MDWRPYWALNNEITWKTHGPLGESLLQKLQGRRREGNNAPPARYVGANYFEDLHELLSTDMGRRVSMRLFSSSQGPYVNSLCHGPVVNVLRSEKVIKDILITFRPSKIDSVYRLDARVIRFHNSMNLYLSHL